MKVEFENSDGERSYVGESDTRQGCFQIINNYLKEHDFKSYYKRITHIPERDELWIDFGSHTEFFYIVL